MLCRDDIKNYALQICVPLLERSLKRAANREFGYKADQVGYIPTALENFCRPFWGITPLLAEGEEIILKIGNSETTVQDYVREMLVNGLNSEKPEHWGQYKEYFDGYNYENQNITELAGLMVGLFFARKQLWDPMEQEERDLIAAEIYQMSIAAFDHSWPNNHYWFPLLAVTVLKRFGYQFERIDEILKTGLDFLESLYIGAGWYKDGEFGRFDYYEAWSLHLYPLLWTLIADNSFQNYEHYRQTYIERTNQFLQFYIYWFDEKGAHVPFGRSLSYRFAASSVFPVAVLAGCDIEPEIAGRITAMNIEFFKNNCRFEETEILQEGYLYRTTNVIEGYTSDGGAYWCCKTFLALLIGEDHPFWNYENARLPIEEGNYLVVPKHKGIHMLFQGHDGMITLYNNTAHYCQNNMLSHKFGDLKGWYSKFVYHSAAGFGCSCSDNVSIDNMVALTTPDRAMTSHRLGFIDLGYENGILHSKHVPFANDKESIVESWIVPMEDVHVRVHKIRLSQPYYISEGGFALGRWDDYCLKERGENFSKVSTREYVSEVRTICRESDILSFGVGYPQANYHLYAPLAEYPMFSTKKPLDEGEYILASIFALYRVGKNNIHYPDLYIREKCVEIKGNNINVIIDTGE